ncbi:hypothetical protein T03_13098 [Trichinella britovi]|uniref:Uncharacterized protein n=1 Tax=Trichinella britovi TaxID=45882 RepID=A0A0V1D0G2_TRIBR|nr:hypothetical protein T03_13098 [Trichinella britovi]KRZ90595.1 hypothetical protein T08_15285 [Trichinella sp. T8]
MQQYKDSEQSDVRTWRSLHLIHSCGKLVTELEVNSHLTSFEEKRSAKEASPQEEEIQNNQGLITTVYSTLPSSWTSLRNSIHIQVV